jgi:hypothetical protein
MNMTQSHIDENQMDQIACGAAGNDDNDGIQSGMTGKDDIDWIQSGAAGNDGDE